MQWIAHAAPVASGLSAAGIARSIAGVIAVGMRVPDAELRARATGIEHNEGAVGKVHARGVWRDSAIHAQLSETLGMELGFALRAEFEWYCCRGAFFHNDAHYDARLFGVWYIAGPAMELVFPRAAVRLGVIPGSIVVFDPFEVHGVLTPGARTYVASDYQGAHTSVFLGFELDLTPAVAYAFGIRGGAQGQIISSQTRISAASGVLELD